MKRYSTVDGLTTGTQQASAIMATVRVDIESDILNKIMLYHEQPLHCAFLIWFLHSWDMYEQKLLNKSNIIGHNYVKCRPTYDDVSLYRERETYTLSQHEALASSERSLQRKLPFSELQKIVIFWHTGLRIESNWWHLNFIMLIQASCQNDRTHSQMQCVKYE